MLSSTLLGAFTTPVTYVLIFVLLATAIMQVRYVNKALQRYDSTQVIPIQFVTFTLCVIIGSAVLYRDFERTSTEQASKFVGGCLLTFFGVFLITSGRKKREDEDELSDAEGIEETIGLRDQDHLHISGVPDTPTDSTRSRRSSRASRVSFADNVTKPLSMQRDSGRPSVRLPAGVTRNSASAEAAPLINNNWRDSADENQLTGTRMPADEVPITAASTPSEIQPPSTPLTNPQGPFIHPADRPVTPRASLSLSRQHGHLHGPFISPSPLSSTVSAVVKDTLLRNSDSPIGRRSSLSRIRSSIRASLFMPEDEDDVDDPEQGQGVSSSQALLSGQEGRRSIESDDDRDSSSKGSRRRSRSLSDTLGRFFKGKKKKGTGTDTEDDQDDDFHV
jgi:magnesium transporter